MTGGATVTGPDDPCIAALLAGLWEKDPYTAGHARNVAFYAEQIAGQLSLPPTVRATIVRAALLHDIGKLGVPDMILTSRSRLTPLEQMVMDEVPLIGARILAPVPGLQSERQIVRAQREHFDGSGVPDGLAGERIPIGARIVLVADELDAMTTDRVYLRRRCPDEAMGELERGASAQFDPDVVAALRRTYQLNAAAWERKMREAFRAGCIPAVADTGMSVGIG